jgi:hypothetical protein
MKLLLAVLALISAGPVAADCPKAADWARAFYSEHYSFYADPSDRVLQFTTPEFGALLKREWAYSKERSGIWITTPGLEARTEKLASRFASPSKRSRRIRQLSPCHIRSCLTPSTRPNGTRCTWYCASENTSAGSFKISSLRAATRCHMCTHFRSPNQSLQLTATRCAFSFFMTKTVSEIISLVPGSRGLSSVSLGRTLNRYAWSSD